MACGPQAAADTLLWRPEDGFIPGPELSRPRFEHDSAALSDGSVLVFSGRESHATSPKLVDVERIDPHSLASEVVGALTEERREITAIAEPGDTVVVLGDSFVVAERFDTPVDVELPFVSAFLAPLFSAARRGNGEIVTLGGINGSFDTSWFARGPELIDLDNNSSRLISADAGEPTRYSRQALALPDGSVLLLGNPGETFAPGPWLIRLDAETDTLITLQELPAPAVARWQRKSVGRPDSDSIPAPMSALRLLMRSLGG